MDMDSLRLDWNHLRAFLTTVEAGSLSGAARRLGMTQPTLGRQIAALEQSLDLTLFERGSGRLRVTEAGQTLIDHARGMAEAANRLSLSASGQRTSLQGLVRITAGDIMSAYVLPEVIATLRRRAPLITVEVIAADDIKDLIRRDADIALRHVRPEQPDLVARLLREKNGYFYASTSYLDAHGRPENLSDLAQLDWIAMGKVDRVADYMTAMGIPLTQDAFRVASENGLVAWEMARAGLGVSAMDEEIAALDPRMERILPELLHVKFPMWLVAHRELYTSPRIRLVFDVMAEMLSSPAERRPLPL